MKFPHLVTSCIAALAPLQALASLPEMPEPLPVQLSINEEAHQPATTTENGSIRIRIENLRSNEGMIGIALFTTDRGFPSKPEKAFASTGLELAEGATCLMLENIPYGNYALSVLHDENSNRKMDKTFIGIPKEGFGTSNNPKISYGPPDFEESEFTLDREEMALVIDMNYFNKKDLSEE